MYTVIRTFQDKDGRVYQVGDNFPHDDAKKPTNARIKSLSSINNDYKKIYIEKIEK